VHHFTWMLRESDCQRRQPRRMRGHTERGEARRRGARDSRLLIPPESWWNDRNFLAVIRRMRMQPCGLMCDTVPTPRAVRANRKREQRRNAVWMRPFGGAVPQFAERQGIYVDRTLACAIAAVRTALRGRVHHAIANPARSRSFGRPRGRHPYRATVLLVGRSGAGVSRSVVARARGGTKRRRRIAPLPSATPLSQPSQQRTIVTP